ncbi:MAG: AMP-binding protein [Massilia sp.]
MAENDFADAGLVPVSERLRQHARATPQRIAYTFLHEDGRAQELSWAELDGRVGQLACALAARLAPGARALLLYPSGLEFIVAYFACLRAGVVAVPATMSHRRRGSRRLPALVADADPALVLTESAWAGAVAACLEQLDDAGCPFLCTDRLDVFGEQALPALDLGATAFLQYTSGSTAQPKGVEVTQANIAANADAIRAAFGFDSRSVMVSWLPLFHDMGLIGSVVAPAAAGFRCVLMAPATFLKHPLRWLDAISRYRGTCAGAPNFGWDYCARRVSDEQKAGLDLSSLAVAYNGSEPVRAATLRAFAAAFAGCGFAPQAQFPCYGMAEATLLVAGGPRGRAPRVRVLSKARLEANQVHEVEAGAPGAREVVSCGPPAPGTTLLVVDPDSSQPVAPHRIGEVWVAGPGVARGYWRRPAQTRAVFGARLAAGGEAGAGFLRTGDLGFVRDGELFLTGRLKDLLVVNGRNIYPQDVEEVIVRAIDFIEPNGCAVFAPGSDGPERLTVVAEANRSLVRTAAHGHPGNARLAQLDALVQQIRTEVARQFGVAVGQVLFVRPGAFPRTTSGKVQRARCKAMALAGELQVVYASDGAARTDAAPAAAPGPAALASRAAADAMIGWLRQYAARRLNSRLIDERRTIPPYVVLDLGGQGFFGLQAPREFGGRALCTVDLMRVLEQLAAVDLTLATMVGVHNGLGLRPLLRFAPAALQRRLLPQLASGRQLAAYAQTEPQAGSNPLAMQSRAVREHGGWRVSGHKHLVGLGSWAGMLTVLAKACDHTGAALGAIALLVPEDAPGLVQGAEAPTMGMRGMVQNSVLLNGVFVPDEYVLLAPGEGMEVARDAMGFARLGIGALCVGAMKRCAQLMARYAARREIGSGRLADNPVTLARLHELACAIYACEALVRAIAQALDARAPLPQDACLACKLLASELLWDGADRLVQMLGGRGYLENNLAPQLLRDARALRILEGPSETLAMHLGASAALADNGTQAFIAANLGRPALAAELALALAQGRAVAEDAAGAQWRDYLGGELCAWALLLAAGEQRAAGEGGGAEAVAWARARFDGARRRLDECAAVRPAAAVLERIDAYADAIGDVEQTLPAEAGELDPLLRRLAPDTTAAEPPAAPPAPSATRQLVYDSVMKWLRSEGAIDCPAIGYDTPFTELGMDSLATVPIALELEQQTALPIAPELLYDYQTVNALAAYIDARRQELASVPAAGVAPGATR